MPTDKTLSLVPFDPVATLNEAFVLLDRLYVLSHPFKPLPPIKHVVRYATLPEPELREAVKKLPNVSIELFAPDWTPPSEDSAVFDAIAELLDGPIPWGITTPECWAVEGIDPQSNCVIWEESAGTASPTTRRVCIWDVDTFLKAAGQRQRGVSKRQYREEQARIWEEARRHATRLGDRLNHGEVFLLDVRPETVKSLADLYKDFHRVQNAFGLDEETPPSWIGSANDRPLTPDEVLILQRRLWRYGSEFALLRDLTSGLFSTEATADKSAAYLLPLRRCDPHGDSFASRQAAWPKGCTYRLSSEPSALPAADGMIQAECEVCGDWFETDLIDASSLHMVYRSCDGIAMNDAALSPPTNQADKRLTDAQQRVYEVIRDFGPIMGQGITNKTGIEQSTLTTHIIPVLKERKGVKNRSGSGYYVE